MREQRVVQSAGESGVSIENRLQSQPPEDAERGLLGKRSEPDQRRVELRRRGRQIHGRSVETLERLAARLPAGENRTETIDELAAHEEVAHPSRSEKELV